MKQPQTKFAKPLLYLIASLILTVVTIVYFSTVGWELYSKEKQALAIQASIEEMIKHILHLDEVLTMSARLYTLTREKHWEDRYIQYEPELDIAIKNAATLPSSIALKRLMSKIKVANERLVAMERKSFLEMRAGRFEQAKGILFSDEYVEHKSIYSNGINKFLEGAKLEVSERVAKYEQGIHHYFQITLVTVLVIWVAIFILFWRYFSAIRGAEEELSLYRNKLESMVQHRTLELEKSVQRIKSYFEMPLMGSVISDLEKGFIDVNEEMCRITGYPKDELLKVTWGEITHPDDLDKDARFFNELISGERDTYTIEKRYVRKDGSSIPVEIFVDCVRAEDGTVDYFVALVQDISERKKVEAEKELLLQMKTEFISTAAHELRTPLTSIRGFSELMKNRDNLSKDAIKRYSESINEEAENLGSIIDDLLDISKIEAKESFILDMNLTSLVDCVNTEVKLLKHQDTGHEFPIEVLGDPYDVLMDSMRVQQILRNLYSNSVKYSNAGCEISTKIEFRDDVVLVSVSDKGKGMTQDQLAHIFDKFYRAEEVKNIQGTGLGMGIVQHLVSAHAGRVWVESEIDKGTTVEFELPRFSPIWRDEFSVKIPSIDTQHKELFNLIGKLAKSIRIGAGEESISLILNELMKYAEFHFKYEEDFFHKYNYPDVGNHIALHKKFEDSIRGFKFILDSENKHLPVKVVSFLYNWLTVHILKEDMAYSSFLEQKMSKDKSALL